MIEEKDLRSLIDLKQEYQNKKRNIAKHCQVYINGYYGLNNSDPKYIVDEDDIVFFLIEYHGNGVKYITIDVCDIFRSKVKTLNIPYDSILNLNNQQIYGRAAKDAEIEKQKIEKQRNEREYNYYLELKKKYEG